MRISIKNKGAIFYLVLWGVLCINSAALALQVDWPGSPAGTHLNNQSTLPVLIQYLYEWGVALGGLAVFIVLLIAGVEYLTSFGNPTSMKNAMDRIQSAFFGLILLLSSWLILNTINPDLTTFRPLVLEPPKEDFGACNTTDDCINRLGKDYKCTEGYCTFDFEAQFTIKTCESVTINYDVNGTAKTATVSKGGYVLVNIAAGDAFTFAIEPRDCMGYLELYPRGTASGCSGDKQEIILSEGKSKDKAGDVDIRCVELKEIEGS